MTDRIKQVMDYKQMSPTAFADNINVNRSSVTHIFTGRNQPSLDVARKILKAFPEISSDWLIMGAGAMLRQEPSPAVSSPTAAAPHDSIHQLPNTAGGQQPDLFADLEEVASDNGESSEIPASGDGSRNPIPQSVPIAEQTDYTNAEAPLRPARRGRSGESQIQDTLPKRERILKSQSDRHLVRVVFFYSDRTCEVYNPS